MNVLERYKKLSDKDKLYLTRYSIYNSIYDVAHNENVDLSDDVASELEELAYDLYLDDEYYNLSAPQIAFFLTECYVNDNSFLDKVKDVEDVDILNAVDDNNYSFYKDDEIER